MKSIGINKYNKQLIKMNTYSSIFIGIGIASIPLNLYLIHNMFLLHDKIDKIEETVKIINENLAIHDNNQLQAHNVINNSIITLNDTNLKSINEKVLIVMEQVENIRNKCTHY
jgi:hypothetical protein